MTIQQSVQAIFQQLEDSLIQLTNQQYCKQVSTLSGATVGQHVRHVVEMFVCLQEGYATGRVNYENRKRDITIESSTDVAINLMQHITASLFDQNKYLVLEAGFDEKSVELNQIPTNYFREIAYNLEHAIHHMALIKIGIHEVADLVLPAGYGVASSTIKYRQSLKQLQ
jgi:hypothetical protein